MSHTGDRLFFRSAKRRNWHLASFLNVRNSFAVEVKADKLYRAGGSAVTKCGLTEADDLSGIENVERIEGALEAPHCGERRLTKFRLKVFHLALADAVLAGAGAVHRERPFDEALRQRL